MAENVLSILAIAIYNTVRQFKNSYHNSQEFKLKIEGEKEAQIEDLNGHRPQPRKQQPPAAGAPARRRCRARRCCTPHARSAPVPRARGRRERERRSCGLHTAGLAWSMTPADRTCKQRRAGEAWGSRSSGVDLSTTRSRAAVASFSWRKWSDETSCCGKFWSLGLQISFFFFSLLQNSRWALGQDSFGWSGDHPIDPSVITTETNTLWCLAKYKIVGVFFLTSSKLRKFGLNKTKASYIPNISLTWTKTKTSYILEARHDALSPPRWTPAAGRPSPAFSCCSPAPRLPRSGAGAPPFSLGNE